MTSVNVGLQSFEDPVHGMVVKILPSDSFDTPVLIELHGPMGVRYWVIDRSGAEVGAGFRSGGDRDSGALQAFGETPCA